jgi:hypothetical protein
MIRKMPAQDSIRGGHWFSEMIMLHQDARALRGSKAALYTTTAGTIHAMRTFQFQQASLDFAKSLILAKSLIWPGA